MELRTHEVAADTNKKQCQSWYDKDWTLSFFIHYYDEIRLWNFLGSVGEQPRRKETAFVVKRKQQWGYSIRIPLNHLFSLSYAINFHNHRSLRFFFDLVDLEVRNNHIVVLRRRNTLNSFSYFLIFFKDNYSFDLFKFLQNWEDWLAFDGEEDYICCFISNELDHISKSTSLPEGLNGFWAKVDAFITFFFKEIGFIVIFKRILIVFDGVAIPWTKFPDFIIRCSTCYFVFVILVIQFMD